MKWSEPACGMSLRVEEYRFQLLMEMNGVLQDREECKDNNKYPTP